MGEKLNVSLPYPPTENHMRQNAYRYTPTGKRYVARTFTKTAKSWVEDAVERVKKEVETVSWKALDCKTVVEMTVYFPDTRRRDASNLLKVTLDVLEKGGVYVNDRWALPWVRDFHVPLKPCEGSVELVIYAKGE